MPSDQTSRVLGVSGTGDTVHSPRSAPGSQASDLLSRQSCLSGSLIQYVNLQGIFQLKKKKIQYSMWAHVLTFPIKI